MKKQCHKVFTILVLMATVWTVRSSGSGLGTRGGEVLPPTAKPKGYSLSDMARATAFFNTGPRTLDTYPNTPFQILYTPPNATSNTFEATPDTIFYLPLFYSDDTAPAIGNFPDVRKRDAVLNYFYSWAQLGNKYTAIVIDGEWHFLWFGYVVGVGPVSLGDAYDDPFYGESRARGP